MYYFEEYGEKPDSADKTDLKGSHFFLLWKCLSLTCLLCTSKYLTKINFMFRHILPMNSSNKVLSSCLFWSHLCWLATFITVLFLFIQSYFGLCVTKIVIDRAKKSLDELRQTLSAPPQASSAIASSDCKQKLASLVQPRVLNYRDGQPQFSEVRVERSSLSAAHTLRQMLDKTQVNILSSSWYGVQS